jgi:[acyl-carrier-protein] S-malonyltransferase
LSVHVATVAGEPIPARRLEERIAELRRGPRGRHIPPAGGPGYEDVCRWVVRELVTEAVLSHEVRARGFTELSRLVRAVTLDVAVADEEVRSYYDRNPDLYLTADTLVPYKEVRSTIQADLLLAARARAFDDWVELRRLDLAVIEPGYEHPADPRYGFPSHRH